MSLNILILCTGNSARSVMAEGLLNHLGQGRVVAYSAGSHPAGKVHPMAIQQLHSIAYDTQSMSSKSWHVFAQPDAPVMDMVITVCDNAANEVCPIWPGVPVQGHWGFSDPAAVQGEGQAAAFADIFAQIRQRVSALLALPLERMSSAELKHALQQIGQQAP